MFREVSVSTLPIKYAFTVSPLVKGPQVIYAMTERRSPDLFGPIYMDMEVCEEQGGQIIGTGRVLLAYPLTSQINSLFHAADVAPQLKERRLLDRSSGATIIRLTGLPVKNETFMAEVLGRSWDAWYVMGWATHKYGKLTPDDPFDGQEKLCDLTNSAAGWQIRRANHAVSA